MTAEITEMPDDAVWIPSHSPGVRVSTDHLIGYSFANDAFLRTDYYFTQGMTLLLVSPALRHSPANRLLGPVPAGSLLHHGIQLHYDGFTPLRIQDAFIRQRDRTYASYIYADLLRVATHPSRRLRVTTAVNVSRLPGSSLLRNVSHFTASVLFDHGTVTCRDSR